MASILGEEVTEEEFRRTSTLEFFKTSIAEQGRLTSNNFFRTTSSRSDSHDTSSASDLISSTSQVIAGGSLSILRKKNHKAAQSNFGPTRLSNDIQSLIADYHKDADNFVHVRNLIDYF
jgi:hypothetical protein